MEQGPPEGSVESHHTAVEIPHTRVAGSHTSVDRLEWPGYTTVDCARVRA